MTEESAPIGLIGCGAISTQYLEGAKEIPFLHISACADLNMEAARGQAATFGCTAMTVDELLEDPDIQLVINLTIPKAHAEVARKCLEAGKHVYSEKPFALSTDEGRGLLDLAEQKKLLVGCAPDTFLGGGLQTARKVYDDNRIGKALGGTVGFAGSGHHGFKNPFFFFQKGGGPLMDMGPYYLTALVAILGPAKGVSAMCRQNQTERTATHEDILGQTIPVDIETHFSGVIEFVSGALINVTMSFDVHGHKLPCLELYGSEGSLSLPDPNTFGGAVSFFPKNGEDWEDVPLTHAVPDKEKVSRGRILGVADMILASRENRPHRAHGKMAFHVLEIMEAFTVSSNKGAFVALQSTCERPLPLPAGLAPWSLTGLLQSLV